jgi:tetratricopeptide (TPR) repeat protein
MKNRKLNGLFKRLFSNTYQLQRIVILTGVLLAILLVGFGAYYYSDRYMSPTDNITPIDKNVSELEEAIRKDPQNTDMRLALAEAYLRAENYDAAIVQAQEVIKISPDKDGAFFILGLAHTSMKRFDQAILPLTKYIEIREKSEMANVDQTLETALYFLGESYLQTKKPQEAIAPLTRALEINKTDADALYKLGLAYAQTGQHEKAITYYEKAALFVPNYAEVYDGMAKSFDALGQPIKATYARGMLSYSINDFETARIELEQVVVQTPDYAPAFVGLALVYEKLGNLEQAKTSVEAALLIDPNNFSAQQTLGRIQASMSK